MSNGHFFFLDISYFDYLFKKKDNLDNLPLLSEIEIANIRRIFIRGAEKEKGAQSKTGSLKKDLSFGLEMENEKTPFKIKVDKQIEVINWIIAIDKARGSFLPLEWLDEAKNKSEMWETKLNRTAFKQQTGQKKKNNNKISSSI